MTPPPLFLYLTRLGSVSEAYSNFGAQSRMKLFLSLNQRSGATQGSWSMCGMCSHPRAGHDNERFHAGTGDIILLLAEAWVDDIDDAVNCQRSFRNVSRHHHLKKNAGNESSMNIFQFFTCMILPFVRQAAWGWRSWPACQRGDWHRWEERAARRSWSRVADICPGVARNTSRYLPAWRENRQFSFNLLIGCKNNWHIYMNGWKG